MATTSTTSPPFLGLGLAAALALAAGFFAAGFLAAGFFAAGFFAIRFEATVLTCAATFASR